jgi:hypothetical protein
VGRDHPVDRFHPGPVWEVEGDRETLRPGRPCRLRLLRLTLPKLHFRLYLICTPDGMPIVWGLANPKIGEREAAEHMLRHDKHLIRPGQIIVGDKGFAGKAFEAFITEELEAELIRPDRRDENPRFGKLGGIRQWVESVFDTMKGQLTLEDHGGRTIPASTPESPAAYSPSPPESGTTGSSEPTTNDPSSPTTIRTHSSRLETQAAS